MKMMLRKLRDSLYAHGRVARARSRHGPSREVVAASDGERALLLFAWEFPPAISGGVYRAAALARYAALHGWKVTVVCGPAPIDPSAAGQALRNSLGSDVRVIRVPRPSLQPSYRLFPHIDGGLLSAVDMSEAARREFSGARPSILIATGPPFHDFVAGLLAGKWSGARLILDYRDEWTQCPFDFVDKGGANAFWERRCVGMAQAIVLTTESQRDRFVEVHGSRCANKVTVIPNGFDSTPATYVRRAHGGAITLLYGGKLGGHTDPTAFLSLLARLVDQDPHWKDVLRVRLVGDKVDGVRASLAAFPFPEILESVPHLTREEISAEMRAADALLLFHDVRFERYLPGKVYEYIAARRPILVLDDIGETRRLIQKLGIGYSCTSDDVNGFAAVLSMLREGTVSVGNEDLESWLREHGRDELLKKFLALMN